MTNERSRNTPYEEDYVIGELRKLSKEFNAFYEAERAKITQPIKWIKNESLGEANPARYNSTKGDIELRRIPAEIEDAMIVAHELQHAVIMNNGFPGTLGNNKKYENLSTALNSMTHDPLVNETLQTYGFDLLEGYTKLKNKSLDELIKSPPPISYSAKMLYVFNYTKDVMLWELIRGEEDSNSKIQQIFESRYPELANVGQGLLALMKSIGYDIPDKMRKLLKEIVLKYRLSDYIKELD